MIYVDFTFSGMKNVKADVKFSSEKEKPFQSWLFAFHQLPNQIFCIQKYTLQPYHNLTSFFFLYKNTFLGGNCSTSEELSGISDETVF